MSEVNTKSHSYLLGRAESKIWYLERERAELLAVLTDLVAEIEDYERVNNLSPSPGRPDCWQSVTRAKAALAKATGSDTERFPTAQS